MVGLYVDFSQRILTSARGVEHTTIASAYWEKRHIVELAGYSKAMFTVANVPVHGSEKSAVYEERVVCKLELSFSRCRRENEYRATQKLHGHCNTD